MNIPASSEFVSPAPPIVGFWGHPTANINWCERDYAHSRFVAETFNTFSNLVYIITALYGLKLCFQRRTHLQFYLLYLSLLVIGVGSFAFHGTLLREMQALDELPMIACVLICFYVIWRLRYRRERKIEFLQSDDFDPKGVKAAAVALTIVSITAFYYLFPAVYALFFVAFTGIALLSMYMLYNLVFKDHSEIVSKEQQIVERRKVKEIVILSFLSLAVWLSDHGLCNATQDTFKLHMMWHFISCMVVARAFSFFQYAFYGKDNAALKDTGILSSLWPSVEYDRKEQLVH